jgi:hypothetical protein
VSVTTLISIDECLNTSYDPDLSTAGFRRSYVATSEGLIEAHDNILRTTNPDIIVPVLKLFERPR